MHHSFIQVQYLIFFLSALTFLACRNGHADVVKWLIDHKVDVNASQSSGSTALHAAAFFGHLSVVKVRHYLLLLSLIHSYYLMKEHMRV
jgi:ankyrin repeat protein